MALICMQEAIIKNLMLRVKAPRGTARRKKCIKKKKIEGEREEKKEERRTDRGEQVLGQLGAIEGHR